MDTRESERAAAVARHLGRVFEGGASHHAYLVSGAREGDEAHVLSFYGRLTGMRTEGNPDLTVITYEEGFTIQHARDIREMHMQRPSVGMERVFILASRFFTLEAQNTLLKSFEEPPAGIRFFLVVPSSDMLLPTLRSRFHLVELPRDDDEQSVHTELARKILAASPGKRLDALKVILADKDKKRAKDGAVRLLDALEVLLYERLVRGVATDSVAGVLDEIVRGRRYLRANGAMMKMILENIVLRIPA